MGICMSKTKERIYDSQLRYQQGLGQNFIYDDDLLEALVAETGIGGEDCVLEIGPGVGTLTRHLSLHAARVLSVELDQRLIPLLKASMEPYGNVEIVHGDAMTVDLAELCAQMPGPLSVAANIPYYITTPLITRLLTSSLPLKRLCVMVQKEVADKLLSSPGSEGWGMLPLRCTYMADVRRAMEVPASCFTPKPKVDSTFIVMDMLKTPRVSPASEEDFFRVAQAGFALRRKTLVNALCAAFHMEREEVLELVRSAGLDEKVRGEKLTLEELAVLSDRYTERRQRNERGEI